MKIFDAHSDIWENVDEKRSRGLNNVICKYHKSVWDAGEIEGGIYPVWVDPTNEVSKLSPEEQFSSIVKNMRSELDQAKTYVQIVTNVKEYCHAVSSDKHAIFLGAEGLSFIQSPDELQELHDLGMRSVSLTWNESNRFACGAGGDNSYGLTDLGRNCIDQMKKIKIMLDLAHAGEKTFWQTIDIWSLPFIVSHACCRSLCAHNRNLSDSQLKAIAEFDGVVGICAYPPLMSEYSDDWNIAQFVRHIIHASEIMGVEHVGLGFDLVDFLDDYGIDPDISYEVDGFESINKAQKIVHELLLSGFSRDEVEMVCRGNFIRVLKSVVG